MRNFLCWLGIVLGLALIVALGITVGPCWAVTETHDVVVLMPRGNSVAANQGWATLAAKNKGRWLFDILDRAGTDYVVLSAAQTKNEWIRTGVFTTAGGNTIVARSEILFGIESSNQWSVTSIITAPSRMDTLSRTLFARGGMQVPSLWMIDNAGEGWVSGGVGSTAWLDSTAATSSINAGVSGTMATGAGFMRSAANPTQTWYGFSYVTGYPKATYPVAGGIRPLLTLYSAGAGTSWSSHTNAKWVDSCAYAYPGAGDDTMVVWDRPWDGVTGAKPVTFLKFAGVGNTVDSTNNLDDGIVSNYDTEGDGTVLLYGLAHFDSLTRAYSSDGKGYIFKNLKKPFELAPIVYGLATRNERRISRGIYPSDTVTAYATMDSIRAYRIPVTYAGDPDSGATYPRDFVKAMENPLARFTPQTWRGTDSTVALSAPSATHPVDVWGRWRVRGFYGDDSGVGADTSLTAMLIWQRNLLAARVGASRLSRCAVAPLDDYSPKQMSVERAGSGFQADSLITACQNAGYTTLLSNVRYRYNNPSYHPTGSLPLTNPRGWFTVQGRRYNRQTAQGFYILGHNEQPMYSGVNQAVMGDDSSATGNYFLSAGVQRAFAGAVYNIPHMDLDQQGDPNSLMWANYANWYTNYKDVRRDMEEDSTLPQRANALSLSFASISGDPAAPARNGWWTLKYLNNAFANINEAAGQTIIRWAYPEDITR